MGFALTSVEDWRAKARQCLSAGIHPDDVDWDGSSLFVAPPAETNTIVATRVPRRFMVLAAAVACHRSASRWDALYRVLWRLTTDEPHLLEVATDPQVHKLFEMERAVRRSAHKMKAFVRFRIVDESAADAHYVAWFEPIHDVTRRVAPFFARRFPSMRWTIMTPDACAHWDLASLSFTPGVSRNEAPGEDALEELWRSYYANIFNPARVAVDTMRAEMPRQYWRNLPEATLIADLTRDAPRRVAAMIAQTLEPPEELPDDLDAVEPWTRCEPVVESWHPVHDPGVSAARARTDDRTAAAIAGTILVGVASWTDPTLTARGVFYPDDVRTAEQRLRYYASRFPIVEVDSTYYSMPSRENAVRWAERTPDDFVFNIKAYALMTGHYAERKRMPDWLRRALPPEGVVPGELRDEIWRRFLGALQPLSHAGKLGAIVLQFPRWFAPSKESAATLCHAREALGEICGAIEFRNPQWVTGRMRERTMSLLRELDLTYVIVDGPQGTSSSMPPIVEITSPRLAMLRLHGRRTDTWEAKNDPVSERYRYLYDRSELEAWTPHIFDIAYQVQGVHVVHNNCHANYGTANATEITAILDERDRMKRASILRA